jgi:hypothetical protein
LSTIFGCETPRIYTPPRIDPLTGAPRILTEDTSDGFAAIAFAEEILELTLFPWEKWLLIHGLELNDDWTYRFRTIVVEAARQNGKTTLLVILALWHLYAKGSRTVIATAQDLGKAEDSWAAAVEFAQEHEELNDLIRKITLAHPKVLKVMNPQIEKLCEYRVATASRRGGRGFSGDLVLLDELREHQTWDSWGAVTKTMMARPRAQCWCFSNAADALGIVLRHQRAKAHRDLGWPDDDAAIQEPTIGVIDPGLAQLLEEYGDTIAVGYYEWSVPPNALRTDREAWAQANPAMNHTECVEDCVTDRAIAHALVTDPIDVFDTEVMCRQIDTASGGPFPDQAWAGTLDDNANDLVKDARPAVCVEISTERSAYFIAKAAQTDAGCAVVGIIEAGPGTEGAVTWLENHRKEYAGIVVRCGAGSPNLSLHDALIGEDEDHPLFPVIDWKTTDVGAAWQGMYDRVRDSCLVRDPEDKPPVKPKTLKHLSHPGLDTAACTAVIKLQPGGAWIVDGNKSPHDVAPLYAAAGAIWGLDYLPDIGPSMYSDAGGGASVFVF